MKHAGWNGFLSGAAFAVCIVGLAQAAGAGPSVSDESSDEIARLGKLLDAQQSRIAALKQELVAARAQDQDAARVEAMRQQIREVLGEQEFRENLMGSTVQAGYDNGFFIRSTDDKFLMKVNGLMQFRWTHYNTQRTNRYTQPRFHRDDRTGFDFERVRICFSGHAYDPDLTYLLELAQDVTVHYDSVLSWAYIDYRFSDALHVRAGKFKIASTRANTTPHSNLQFISRPMVDGVFGIGFGLGVRFWGKLFHKHVDWYLDVLNSASNGEGFGNGRTITNDPAELDNNPALAFRLVWHALCQEDARLDALPEFVNQSDIELHTCPVLDFGVHYVFNDDAYDLRTTRIPFPVPRRQAGQGGFGLTTTNGLQINQFGCDAHFKYMGFSVLGEYIVRLVDPRRADRRPFAPWWLLTRQGDTTAQQGAYIQTGYFLPIPGFEKKIEAVARVGGVSTLANGQEGSWEYGAGLNYYIQGQSVKLMTDFFKIYETPISSVHKSLANVNDDALVFRVQLQLTF